uniref:Uncharacterized protein n=1 Tax=Glossina pallidipes TaxID=7398 RepID=A0A1A9ZPL0_GLOPL
MLTLTDVITAANTQSYTCTHVGQVSLHSIPLNPPSAIGKRNANTNTDTNTNTNTNNNTIAFIRYNQVIEYISTFCVKRVSEIMMSNKQLLEEGVRLACIKHREKD